MNPDQIYEYAARLNFSNLRNLCSTNRYFRDLCRTERFKQLIQQKYEKTVSYQVSQLKQYDKIILEWPNRRIVLRKDYIYENSSPDISLVANLLVDYSGFNNLTNEDLETLADKYNIGSKYISYKKNLKLNGPLALLSPYVKNLGINVESGFYKGKIQSGITDPPKEMYNDLLRRIEQEPIPNEIIFQKE